MMPTLPPPPGSLQPSQPGLWNLIQFMIEIAKGKRYLKMTITWQAGQIERVHVDESYTLDKLPVQDKGRVALLSRGGLTRKAVEDAAS